MISLIDSQHCRYPGIFAGIKGQSPGYKVREEYILGMRVIRADLQLYDGIGYQRRRRKREIKRLYNELFRRNIGQILLSRDFPPEAEFDKFKKADTICLYESIAGAVGAVAAKEEGGGSGGGGGESESKAGEKEKDEGRRDAGRTAAFIAGSVGIREERSLIKLAENYRYLIVEAGRDSSSICQGLRRRFGIAVIENPTASQYLNADFAVILSKPHRSFELRRDCLIYSPNTRYSGKIAGGRRIEALRLKIPDTVLNEIPQNFNWPPIVSEAIKCGFYSPEDVQIQGFKLEGNGLG